VQSLVAKQEATVDFRSSSSNFDDAFSRGGIVYVAATRAGRMHQWGPLNHNTIYYVWAISAGGSSSEASIVRAFALREAIPGTTAFIYSAVSDQLELGDLPSLSCGNISHSNIPIRASDNLHKKHSSPPPLSPAELRERRLASLGIADTTARPHSQSCTLSPPSTQESASAEEASVNKDITIQPKDHPNLIIGTTVVLETQIKVADDFVVSYQWLFSPKLNGSNAPEVLVGTGMGNRRHLRIDPVGLAHEGVYWCVVHTQRKSSTDAECMQTRHAVVELSALDRYILQRIESIVDEFEMSLPPFRFLCESPEKTASLVPIALRATQVIGDILNLTGTSDPLTLGDQLKGLCAYDVRSKARALSAQLPVEVSTLLGLKARAHLLISVGASMLAATDGTNRIDKQFHAEQSRRDAATALKVVPGDRDALHVHAEASERCGRLTDAIESLTMLRRLSSSTSHGSSVDGQPAWNDYASRLAILEQQREEERRLHRANASNRNNDKTQRFGQPYYESDHYASEQYGPDDHTSTGDRRSTNHQRAYSAPSSSPEMNSSKSDTSMSWHALFAQQEEAWELFCSQMDERDGKAPIIDSELSIPWPNESLKGFQYVGVDVKVSRRQKKQAIKKMLLRWHPDKFTQKFSKRFVSSELREICRTVALGVTRRLNDLSETL